MFINKTFPHSEKLTASRAFPWAPGIQWRLHKKVSVWAKIKTEFDISYETAFEI